MRLWILSILLSTGYFAFNQIPGTLTIYHKHYSTTFSKSGHYPVVVEYLLTKDVCGYETKIKWTNRFISECLEEQAPCWKITNLSLGLESGADDFIWKYAPWKEIYLLTYMKFGYFVRT
jgi:hypothetical protein